MSEQPSHARAADLDAAEAWFTAHGLPYFISRDHAAVEAALSRPRLVTLGAAALALSAGVGVVIGLLAGDASVGMLTGLVTLGVLVLAYAWTQLRMRTIARWALRRTLGSLGLMFPLLTRALPLLLLFITFLFINTEVWQVASDMDRGVLGIAVLLFAAIAAGFLLVRLPEEVRRVEDEVGRDRLSQCCEGTPLAAAAVQLPPGAGSAPLPRLQRANLVLVLLFSQAVQVLLLSLTVLAFFLVFGKVAISPDVMESWLGHGPTDLAILGGWSPVSNELFQVAVFSPPSPASTSPSTRSPTRRTASSSSPRSRASSSRRSGSTPCTSRCAVRGDRDAVGLGGDNLDHRLVAKASIGGDERQAQLGRQLEI